MHAVPSRLSCYGLPLAIFDLETTGFSGADRIVQISVVHAELGIGAARTVFSSLLRSGRPSHPRARAVHGLALADLEDAPTFAAVAASVLCAFQQRVPVAHNLRFDLRMLNGEFERVGYPRLSHGICTLQLSKTQQSVFGYSASNLSVLCSHFGILLDRHHDADCDAHACYAVLCRLLGVDLGDAWRALDPHGLIQAIPARPLGRRR